MPSVQPLIISQPSCPTEKEELYLPSHFSEMERSDLGLCELAQEEVLLREGQAYESIIRLRSTVKALSWYARVRKGNDRGQRQATRGRARIAAAELLRDSHLLTYNHARSALESLTHLGPEGRFPPLTKDDCFRKSTVDKRQVGDTYRPDGRLWRVGVGGNIPAGKFTFTSYFNY
jgi:hypothetical protein